MPASPRARLERHSEADRLIALARGLLECPEEEMVALYLDQAIETLRAQAERDTSESEIIQASPPIRAPGPDPD